MNKLDDYKWIDYDEWVALNRFRRRQEALMATFGFNHEITEEDMAWFNKEYTAKITDK